MQLTLTAEDAAARLQAAMPTLSAEEQLQGAAALRKLLDEAYSTDGWRWAVDLVQTRDEATSQLSRWPGDLVYLRDIWQAIDECPRLAIPKSRRMMVTWIVSTYMTHRARYYPNWVGYVQSETETKAGFVVEERCKFIEDNLVVPSFRREHDLKRGPFRLTYRKTGSYIQGIPQGGDVLRTYTPSFLFEDESEFQPEAVRAFQAALPTIEKGVKMVVASSSNGPRGLLAGMCKDVGFVRFGT